MKKFIIASAIIIILPTVTMAAFQATAPQTPVQPMPENTAPNLNGNANTPGNDYNQSQGQALEQIGETRAPSEDAQNPETSVPQAASAAARANLYIILIVVCGLVLLALFGWVIYRFRIKKD
jgi:hypothetical protein